MEGMQNHMAIVCVIAVVPPMHAAAHVNYVAAFAHLVVVPVCVVALTVMVCANAATDQKQLTKMV